MLSISDGWNLKTICWEGASCIKHSAVVLMLLCFVSSWIQKHKPQHICLVNSLDYSPWGSLAHGILQARILEWAAISFSINTFKRIEIISSIFSDHNIHYETGHQPQKDKWEKNKHMEIKQDTKNTMNQRWNQRRNQ